MNELQTSRYWFGQALPGFHWADYIFMGYAAFLIVLGIVLLVYRRSTKDRLKKDLIRRWYYFAFTIGILGLIWTGLRYELVRVLSTRFMIVLIYFIGDLWILWLLKYSFVDYKKNRQITDREEQKRKYM
jgi:hypothetical protein